VTELPAPLQVPSTNGKVEVQSDRALALAGLLARWADERGVEVADLEISRPTLEDVYLELTKDRT